MTSRTYMVTNVLSTLFLLHFAHFSAKKTGDFGMFTVCRNEGKGLRMDCWYPECSGSPQYSCTFLTEKGQVMGSNDSSRPTDSSFKNKTLLSFTEDGKCRLFLFDHNVSVSTNYTCELRRQKITEKKKIDIKHKTLKMCPSIGLLIHPSLKLLWTTVALIMLLHVVP